VSSRRLCGYHRRLNENGEILFPDNPSWGSINNDFQIVHPRSVYEEKAGAECWILLDHHHQQHNKGNPILVIFLQEKRNEFFLPFAIKLRDQGSNILDIDNAIQTIEELKIKPIGFVGDSAFKPILESSLYSNLYTIYDPFHVFGGLVTNNDEIFPTFPEMNPIMKLQTPHRSARILEMLQMYKNDGDPDERALMEYILPQFNLGSMYLNKPKLKELMKRVKGSSSRNSFINNIFVLEILKNQTFPNTAELESIMCCRRKLNFKDLLLSLQNSS